MFGRICPNFVRNSRFNLHFRALNVYCSSISVGNKYRTYHTGQNSSDSHRWNKKTNLLVKCGMVTAFTIASVELWRRYKNNNYTQVFYIIPSIHAASLFGSKPSDETNTTEDKPVGSSGDGNINKNRNNNFIADTVEKAAPAVVYIEIQGRHPLLGRTATVSNGSGFIVKQDGLILTNAHVVANKQNVQVTLNDGRKFKGVVQAVDPVTDLATIRIPAKDLPCLELADSGRVRPGEWVVAMGSPLSLSNTVTAGIVSTVHRGSKELGLHNKDMEYIQTDAVINFGNSGGPLVNLDGQAIGISSMKVTTGISFAIPAKYAIEFLHKAQLLDSKKGSGWFGSESGDKRRYIGVTMLTLTPSIAAELRNRMDNFPDIQSGVFIHRVVVGSPAYSGGVRPGDVILEINRRQIQTANDVHKELQTTSRLVVKIFRGHDVITLDIDAEEVDE